MVFQPEIKHKLRGNRTNGWMDKLGLSSCGSKKSNLGRCGCARLCNLSKVFEIVKCPIVRVNVCVIERHQEAKDEPAGTPVPVRIVRPKGWALGFGGCPGIRCFGLLNNLCSKPFKSQPGWGSFWLSWQPAL